MSLLQWMYFGVSHDASSESNLRLLTHGSTSYVVPFFSFQRLTNCWTRVDGLLVSVVSSRYLGTNWIPRNRITLCSASSVFTLPFLHIVALWLYPQGLAHLCVITYQSCLPVIVIRKSLHLILECYRDWVQWTACIRGTIMNIYRDISSSRDSCCRYRIKRIPRTN